MRFPSKVTTYKESVISKFPIVLQDLENSDMTPTWLYHKLKEKFNYGLAEYIDVLDCLYSLGKITLDMKTETLHYVG